MHACMGMIPYGWGKRLARISHHPSPTPCRFYVQSLLNLNEEALSAAWLKVHGEGGGRLGCWLLWADEWKGRRPGLRPSSLQDPGTGRLRRVAMVYTALTAHAALPSDRFHTPPPSSKP